MNPSSTSISIFKFNEDEEIRRIGFIYSIVALCVFPLYAIVIYALHTRDELRNNISYKLMNIINYCDVTQAICHFLTGLFLTFPVFAERYDVFVRIVGCTANSLWLAMFPVMSILATTRILIAFNKSSPTKWNNVLKISLGAGFIYIFIVWIVGCITQNFMLSGPSWSYDMDVPYAELFANLELILCFPTLILSFVSYILIVFSIYIRRRKSQSNSSLKMEIAILVQATILTAYMAILITLWHNAEHWFKMTNTTIALLNGSWIMFSYINPILLILTNGGVRRQILRICASKFSDRSSFIGKSIHKMATPPRGSMVRPETITAGLTRNKSISKT